jgi:hypothetical protein
MEKIEVDVEMGILFRGALHGLAFFKYKDPKNNKNLSFSGVGIFNQGILATNAPFITINKEGVG